MRILPCSFVNQYLDNHSTVMELHNKHFVWPLLHIVPVTIEERKGKLMTRNQIKSKCLNFCEHLHHQCTKYISIHHSSSSRLH